MTTTTGTCTITRLRNGDIIYATLQLNRATSVAYEGSTIIGGFSAESPLVVKLLLTSASGSNVSLKTGGVWTCDAVPVAEKGIGSVSADGTLTITSNDFMDAKNPRNHIFEFTGTARLGGVEHAITKSFEVTMISSGGNSYWGSIVPSGSTILSDDNTTVNLVPSLTKGGETITDSYTVKWYKNNETTVLQPSSGNTLTVSRGMVDGATLFRCEFYIDGNMVEADSITVVDVADDYQIVLNSEYQVSMGSTAKIKPQLYNANTKSFVSPKTWTASVKNNYTLADVPTGWTIDAESGEFSMSEENMYYIPAPTDANFIGEGKKVEYNPIVIFTAEI